MFFGDVFGGLYTILINSNSPRLAGLCDGLEDVGNGVSVVGAGATAFYVTNTHIHVNFTWWTPLAYVAIIAGSELGAIVADLISLKIHSRTVNALPIQSNSASLISNFLPLNSGK